MQTEAETYTLSGRSTASPNGCSALVDGIINSWRLMNTQVAVAFQIMRNINNSTW